MYLTEIDEHISQTWYKTSCTYNSIRETFLKEFYKNYVKFCELNYQYNSITGGSYVPLGRNRFNLDLFMQEYLNSFFYKALLPLQGPECDIELQQKSNNKICLVFL
uniref:Uncharacterized protein n=1 Tax=Pseudoderbesia arbuscula TaxID=2320809 RepID=A0A386AYN5_9CHLO|nr:hypothetical protein [Pseudoderbesia arbuscula]